MPPQDRTRPGDRAPMYPTVQIAATGMQNAQALMALHAHAIANVSTDPAQADLAGDVVGLVVAHHAYTANARLLTVMADTERSLLDIRA